MLLHRRRNRSLQPSGRDIAHDGWDVLNFEELNGMTRACELLRNDQVELLRCAPPVGLG